jgi:hypothetical protein
MAPGGVRRQSKVLRALGSQLAVGGGLIPELVFEYSVPFTGSWLFERNGRSKYSCRIFTTLPNS